MLHMDALGHACIPRKIYRLTGVVFVKCLFALSRTSHPYGYIRHPRKSPLVWLSVTAGDVAVVVI